MCLVSVKLPSTISVPQLEVEEGSFRGSSPWRSSDLRGSFSSLGLDPLRVAAAAATVLYQHYSLYIYV